MGEVYRAKDTRLDRSVALKVLPKELSQDAELRARLTREARAVSALNHPHICALYDVGSEDGRDYLVMELLEGETLADRIAKGPLPTEQVLRFGREIAEALDRAHRSGVVHRDLKPGNVMLTKSGVKLLDFGLAKVAAKEMDAAVSTLPTRLASQPLTEKGTILGTFQYMAPEQLEGKEADARADIFALGAVLHEMATGKKAFGGASQASLIAAILSSEPPAISAVQKMSPPALDRLVKTCLTKDPDERWQSAHDVAAELKWIAEGGSQVGAPAVVVSRRRSRERLAWTLAALTSLGAVALGAALVASRAPRGAREVVRLALPQPKPPVVTLQSLIPSPDGRRIACIARTAGDKSVLAVRALDAEDAQPIAGTEGALQPFWSPDGRSLGFFADGKLKRVALAGGPPRVLASAPTSWGGAWGAGGDIVFSSDPLGGLSRVSAEGGTPQVFTTLGKGEEAHHWPSFLPDGRHFVFLGDAPTTAGHTLRLGSLDSGSSVEIVHAVSNVSFVPPDLLLFVRAGTLLAQRFDPKSGKARGEPVPLGAPIARLGDQHEYDFGASAAALAFRTRAPETRLTWIDRTGKRLESVGEPQLYSAFRISPDGRRVVYARRDRDERPENIWVLDLARGSVTRVSSTPDGDFNPAWSPDGSRVYFSSYRGGKQGDVYATPSGGGGPDELVFASPDDKMPVAVTPDGRTLLLETLTQSTKGDVDVVSLPEKKRTPFAATPFDERLGDLSPDGRFVAYSSDESGRHEVYVKPIGGGNRVPVSSGGGEAPVFRPDGKELFYISPAGMLMAAPVTPGPAFEAGSPRPICSAAAWGGYAVSRDGERFLVSLRADDGPPGMTVVLDWTRLVAP